ncbi:MAG: cupin [Cellvibrionales bacterium TMED49]|nr:cupin [Porticoccaceae bacterium]OUU37720.1 MAG: cupin [Cellvibrionales bacterium TMED49]
MLNVNEKVEEFAGATADHIPEDLMLSKKPLVLRGLVSQWPFVRENHQGARAGANYLQKFDVNRSVTACVGSPETSGRIFYNSAMDGFNFSSIRMSLSDALKRIISNQSLHKPQMLYVSSTNVDHWLPGFRKENNLHLMKKKPLVSIWLGNQSRIAAHFDFASNIACSVAGKRKFILFPPEQIKNLYIGPLDFTPAGQPVSMVDFANPDYITFPKFKNALETAQYVQLEPGDAIFIPSMWWHHVEALDTMNILINYWWRNSPEYLGSPLGALQHAILALRELPEDQRQVWRDLFDHYVFEAADGKFDHIPQQARGILNPIDFKSAERIKLNLSRNLA